MTSTNSKEVQIYFRADANSTIGFGHLIRTLALMSYLSDIFNCILVIKNPSHSILETISESNQKVLIIEDENDFFEIVKSHCIVVLDGYNFVEEYQIRVRKLCFKLVCIDDVFDRKFCCDVIINHGEGIKTSDYKCEKTTKIFLGLSYALLRKPFLSEALLSKERKINEIENIFVCFGGSDSENYTLDTVTQLMNISNFKKINIIVGSAYLYFEELEKYCNKIDSCKINLYCNLNADQIITTMLDSHLAIVPSSSILYEVLAIKMPIITGYSASNQLSIYNSLVNKGLVVGAGAFPINDLEKQIEVVIKDKTEILNNQIRIFDGKSAERFIKIFNDIVHN